MDHPTDELDTPAQRIQWAIDDSGKTLTQIADEIGCSHAALSQWATAKTIAENIKAGLLNRFSEVTGVRSTWLLTGREPVRDRYMAKHEQLMHLAREIDAMDDHTADQAERVLRALLPKQQH
jgi:transcriptional regulator with XRE-family HTH domain